MLGPALVGSAPVRSPVLPSVSAAAQRCSGRLCSFVGCWFGFPVSLLQPSTLHEKGNSI